MNYGYARVSTDGQSVAAQVATLTAAGAGKVFREVASGAKTDRAQLRRLLDQLDAHDVLMMDHLDRLARPIRGLLNIAAVIAGREAGLRSLGDTWADVTMPHGRLMIAVLGGLADVERDLIRTRRAEGRSRAEGATLAELAKSYNVDRTTISRLAGRRVHSPMTPKVGGWRSSISGWCFMLSIFLVPIALVYSCVHNDKRTDVDKKAAEAKRLEQLEQEASYFATPELARVEIERRLALRLVRYGRTLVANSGDGLHTVSVVPISIPWIISCDILGLRVELGNSSSGENSIDSMFITIISIERASFLSLEKCKEIAPIFGNIMTAITYAPPALR